MTDWHIVPEIVGRNVKLRMAVMQAVDAVQQDRNFVVEGEAGSGRRLLARSVWYRRNPGARSLFTLDCRMFPSDGVDALLFGERSSTGDRATICLGKLNLSAGGGLLLLNAELLQLSTQRRLAQVLRRSLLHPGKEAIQLMMTGASSEYTTTCLHPELAALLLQIRVPALRERVEDIRAITECFLRNASPFERIRCSEPLIERFCSYEWPGNVTELRSVLRRLLMERHNGLLDVCHLADLLGRDDTCLALLQGGLRLPRIEADIQTDSSIIGRSLQ